MATQTRARRPAWLEFVETLAVAFILAFLIRTFVLESFQVSGHSMRPTFHNGDRVLVSKLAYDFGSPKTGEIIVFQSPVIPSEDWIKRVIGVPGDTVSIRHNKVYINGKLYPEPFLKYRSSENYGPVKVPKGSLFVLGDNRPDSYDSRYFGFLKENRVVGEAFVTWWPLSRLRWF